MKILRKIKKRLFPGKELIIPEVGTFYRFGSDTKNPFRIELNHTALVLDVKCGFVKYEMAKNNCDRFKDTYFESTEIENFNSLYPTKVSDEMTLTEMARMRLLPEKEFAEYMLSKNEILDDLKYTTKT